MDWFIFVIAGAIGVLTLMAWSEGRKNDRSARIIAAGTAALTILAVGVQLQHDSLPTMKGKCKASIQLVFLNKANQDTIASYRNLLRDAKCDVTVEPIVRSNYFPK